MTATLTGGTAIVGIGQTEFSNESGRTEIQLAAEASSAAITDAGLTPSDIHAERVPPLVVGGLSDAKTGRGATSR